MGEEITFWTKYNALKIVLDYLFKKIEVLVIAGVVAWAIHSEHKDTSTINKQTGLLWHEAHQIENGTK